MTALKRRATEGGSWLVRASLAQTGYWLRRLGRIDGVACPDPTFEDVRDRLEEVSGLRPADLGAPRRGHDGDPAPLAAAVGAARHARGAVAYLSSVPLMPKRKRASSSLAKALGPRFRVGRAINCDSASAALNPADLDPIPVAQRRAHETVECAPLLVRHRQKSRDHRRHRDLGRARCAVVAL